MTKSDILRFQHQVLEEFKHCADAQKRKALLEVIKSLEKVATTYKDRSDDSQGKPLQDPARIDNALKKTVCKGEVEPSNYQYDYERAQMAIVKEAGY